MLGLVVAVVGVQMSSADGGCTGSTRGRWGWAWRCLTWWRIVPLHRDAQDRRRDALAAAALAPTALPTTDRRGSGLE